MSITTASNETASAVRSWSDALNHHDADTSLQFMTEDCVFINYGTGERLQGHDAIRADVVGLFSRWSEMHIETIRLLVDGDHFAKQWVMTGIHTGDMPNLPATGRPFSIHGVGIGEVRDGKLVNVAEHWNLLEFLNQVNVDG